MVPYALNLYSNVCQFFNKTRERRLVIEMFLKSSLQKKICRGFMNPWGTIAYPWVYAHYVLRGRRQNGAFIGSISEQFSFNLAGGTHEKLGHQHSLPYSALFFFAVLTTPWYFNVLNVYFLMACLSHENVSCIGAGTFMSFIYCWSPSPRFISGT